MTDGPRQSDAHNASLRITTRCRPKGLIVRTNVRPNAGRTFSDSKAAGHLKPARFGFSPFDRVGTAHQVRGQERQRP
jgi:hypothetical protein